MEPITRSEMLMDGQYVEPKTRKEMILAGEDLEPVTREEYFLKEYRHSGGDVDVVQLTATENKTYTAPEGKAYNPVVVNVPEPVLDSITINENGDYTPPAGVDGFGRVIVDVPTPPPSLQSLTASHNGYFVPSSGYVGFSEVNVDVALPQNAYLLESQKNDVVSIQHGAEFDMPKLIASIEPQQDLHGYDSPWVGGSGKNKLPLTVDGIKSANGGSSSWSGNATTINGVTFTILTDSDNNVTGIKVNGTASINTGLKLVDTITNITPYDNCIINGCPSGGSTSKYRIGVASYDSSSAFVKDYNDLGSGVTLTFSQDNVSKFYVSITIYQGYNAQNLVFKPMIRLSTESDDSFAPYSNICPISGWDEVDVTRCGKNLIPYVELGILNQTDGSEEDNSDNKRTGFIRTLPNTQYTISGLDGSGISIRIFEFKEDKTYIRNYVSSNITNSVTIQTGAEVGYIRYQGNKNIFASNVAQCEKGSTATTYEPYNGNTYTINFVDGSSPLTVYKGEFDVLSGSLKVYPHYDSYNGETINGEWISDRDVYAEGTTPTIGAEVQVMSGSDYTTYQQVANNIKSLEGVNNIYADTGEVDVQIWTKEV
jgi:hypothetical protein